MLGIGQGKSLLSSNAYHFAFVMEGPVLLKQASYLLSFAWHCLAGSDLIFLSSTGQWFVIATGIVLFGYFRFPALIPFMP